jgi:hypothetical protein
MTDWSADSIVVGDKEAGRSWEGRLTLDSTIRMDVLESRITSHRKVSRNLNITFLHVSPGLVHPMPAINNSST